MKNFPFDRIEENEPWRQTLQSYVSFMNATCLRQPSIKRLGFKVPAIRSYKRCISRSPDYFFLSVI